MIRGYHNVQNERADRAVMEINEISRLNFRNTLSSVPNPPLYGSVKILAGLGFPPNQFSSPLCIRHRLSSSSRKRTSAENVPAAGLSAANPFARRQRIFSLSETHLSPDDLSAVFSSFDGSVGNEEPRRRVYLSRSRFLLSADLFCQRTHGGGSLHFLGVLSA